MNFFIVVNGLLILWVIIVVNCFIIVSFLDFCNNFFVFSCLVILWEIFRKIFLLFKLKIWILNLVVIIFFVGKIYLFCKVKEVCFFLIFFNNFMIIWEFCGIIFENDNESNFFLLYLNFLYLIGFILINWFGVLFLFSFIIYIVLVVCLISVWYFILLFFNCWCNWCCFFFVCFFLEMFLYIVDKVIIFFFIFSIGEIVRLILRRFLLFCCLIVFNLVIIDFFVRIFWIFLSDFFIKKFGI